MSRRERYHSGHRKDRERSRSRDRESGGAQKDRSFDHHRGSRGVLKDEFGRSIDSFGRHGDRSISVTDGSRRACVDMLQYSTSQSDLHSTPVNTASQKKEASLTKDINDDEDEDTEMMRIMGFGSFNSSKGTHVHDNDKAAAGTARIKKVHQYRQYMNRRGGFNQSLAKVD